MNLTRTRITDKALGTIKTNRNLRSLYLGETAISDGGITALAELRMLLVLHLSWTDITDRSLEKLSAMQELRDLSVFGTQVGDNGVTALKETPFLSALSLGKTKITNNAIESLSAHNTELVELDLQGCAVDDDCINHLVKLKHLRKVTLNGTMVTVEGLRNLKANQRIKELWLGSSVDGGSVFDILRDFDNLQVVYLMGLQNLRRDEIRTQIRQLKKLREIHFLLCNVGKEDIGRIRAANPGVRITVLSAEE